MVQETGGDERITIVSSNTVAARSLVDNPFLNERIRNVEQAAGPEAWFQVQMDKHRGKLKQIRITVTYQQKGDEK